MITRTDQPSVAMWCVTRASTESRSSNLASTALMSGGLAASIVPFSSSLISS